MNDLKPHHETESAWPADGRPSWAPKFRWIALALVLIFAALLWVVLTGLEIKPSDGYNY